MKGDRFSFFRPWLLFVRPLSFEGAGECPFSLFQKWYQLNHRFFWHEFKDAACLSTCGDDGADGRMVLLKGFSERGAVFFTNSNSKKGKDLSYDKRAALTFFWDTLRRQVRIRGEVSILSAEESDRYFSSRPRGSQVGAWASSQSEKMESTEKFHQAIAELENKFRGQKIPRPPHWNGYLLNPNEFEFWEGRQNRLHVRVKFKRTDNNKWEKNLIYP